MMHKKQSGAVLIVSLIILVVLTLFVISGSQNVLIQEKMTAAVRDMHVSMEIAESGVKDAEDYLDGISNTDSFNDTNGYYSEGNGPSDIFADSTWTDGNYQTAETEISGEYALYFIEYVGIYTTDDDTTDVSIGSYGDASEESDIYLFKIVSRSLGINGNTERIIVSYYAKTF